MATVFGAYLDCTLELLMITFYSYPEKDKMLAKHKVMLHEMYDVIYVISMFMIYECSECACELMSYLAEDR